MHECNACLSETGITKMSIKHEKDKQHVVGLANRRKVPLSITLALYYELVTNNTTQVIKIMKFSFEHTSEN
jgi:hypothetical protein